MADIVLGCEEQIEASYRKNRYTMKTDRTSKLSKSNK